MVLVRIQLSDPTSSDKVQTKQMCFGL